MNVFTPLNEQRTKRLQFNMSDVTVLDGNLSVRGRGYKATVIIKGTTYKVFGASCGLPNCMCDAYLKEVI